MLEKALKVRRKLLVIGNSNILQAFQSLSKLFTPRKI